MFILLDDVGGFYFNIWFCCVLIFDFFLLSREMAHAYGLIRFHWIFRFGAIERDEIFRQIVFFLVFILDCYVVDVRLIFYFILICECFFYHSQNQETK